MLVRPEMDSAPRENSAASLGSRILVPFMGLDPSYWNVIAASGQTLDQDTQIMWIIVVGYD